ncbi:MAG: hypothetical protein QHH07_02525 [Sedimentisphaerales bacterium]|nr:hypothetical protein [Sedimentisphaerales bacterium]
MVRIRSGGVLEPVIPVGRQSWDRDPKYGVMSEVTVGIQEVGGMSYGRPLMAGSREPAFYVGCMGEIRPGEDVVESRPLSGTAETAGSDLALPTCIVWMGF